MYKRSSSDTTQLAWIAAIAVGVCLTSFGLTNVAHAQREPVHYFQRADMPPGSIGRAQLLRGGPLPGYFQPVQLRVPDGAWVAVAVGSEYSESQPEEVLAGLLIGGVYRYRVSRIPSRETQEIYPTVEVINRLHPPPGQEARFPIPIEITQEELELALSGQFVTRVIYLEDPHRPFPLPDEPKRQRYFEVRADQDPLQVADELGRPMAILRMGSRVPDENSDPTQLGYSYGTPPVRLLSAPISVPRDAGLEPAHRVPRLPLSPQAPAPIISKRPQVVR